MSLEHTNLHALQLLFPLELGGEHAADQVLEAKHLDAAEANGEALLLEMYPDQAETLLADWERVCGFSATGDDPFQSRRDRVVNKLRERGGLSIPYFTQLAQTLGYEIEIVEPVPFMAGWGAASDELFDDEIRYQWGVEISNQPVYEFRAGESVAGERLLWWDALAYLETLFRALKPAHTFVYFSYLD